MAYGWFEVSETNFHVNFFSFSLNEKRAQTRPRRKKREGDGVPTRIQMLVAAAAVLLTCPAMESSLHRRGQDIE